MARARRKFPPKRKKERRERRRQAGPTPERMAKHKLLTGRKHANSDDASENPLALLHKHGIITDMQKSAGQAFGQLSFKFRQQLIRTNDTPAYARVLVANGSVANPTEMIEARQEEEQEFYYAMSDKLEKAGRMAVDEVRWIACSREQVDPEQLHRVFRPWAIKEIFTKQPLNFWDTRHRAAFQAGLNALIGK